LKNLHSNNTEKVSDKWESYLDYYNEIFMPLKNKDISLLEIGIQNGGSLQTYLNFFKNAELIVGCDIDDKCHNLNYDDKRIKVVVGNINSNETYSKISSLINQFDILIDDGSHISSDIIISFIKYFPIVKPGGIYVIEDLHCSYDSYNTKKYGGGILNENSAINFFKKIIDVINSEFWTNTINLQTYLSQFFPKNLPQLIVDGSIKSIEFRNSIITIRKSKIGETNKLGKRMITGQEMKIDKIK
jgi:23S rRNA U2552 (ribose-2'-O)-methylase RlmE/FtsJ